MVIGMTSYAEVIRYTHGMNTLHEVPSVNQSTLNEVIIPVATAAKLLGVSPRTVRRLVIDGLLPGFRIGKQFRMIEGEVLQFRASGGHRD